MAKSLEDLYDEYIEPFCFVCSRATDHFAEHDDLVDAGIAEYDKYGCVHVIDSKRLDKLRKS